VAPGRYIEQGLLSNLNSEDLFAVPVPPNWMNQKRRPGRARRPLAPQVQRSNAAAVAASRSSRRTVLLGGVALTVVALLLGRVWWRAHDFEVRLREFRSHQVADASATHNLLDNLFLDFPHAIEVG
jgi:hypothetical protein